MTIQELSKYKRILILGYGREGKANERFLKQFVPSAQILIGDEKLDPSYLDLQSKADLVIKTPIIHKSKVTIPYTTGTNIFLANLPNRERLIGVTGSKGKSTTSSLIAAMLKAGGKKVELLGNIGRSALDVFCDGIDEDALVVMELSSYQLDDIQFAPHVAVFTSVFPEHLDYHGGFEEYFKAKANITLKQHAGDLFIYHPGYPELDNLATKTEAHAIPFEELSFPVESTKLLGQHNLDNMRGAWSVAKRFGVTPEQAKQAIEEFEPLPHRLTNIGTYKGITFIDDAIATAPEPTILAIETLKTVDTIFLGGTDRGYQFDELAKTLKKHQVANVVLFPDTGSRIKTAIESVGDYAPTLLETTDMKAAVEFAYQQTKPGKICLLSTASPSYRLWKDYEEKGNLFTRLVKELGNGNE